VKDEAEGFFSCLTSENLLTRIMEDLADPKLEAPSLFLSLLLLSYTEGSDPRLLDTSGKFSIRLLQG